MKWSLSIHKSLKKFQMQLNLRYTMLSLSPSNLVTGEPLSYICVLLKKNLLFICEPHLSLSQQRGLDKCDKWENSCINITYRQGKLVFWRQNYNEILHQSQGISQIKAERDTDKSFYFLCIKQKYSFQIEDTHHRLSHFILANFK